MYRIRDVNISIDYIEEKIASVPLNKIKLANKVDSIIRLERGDDGVYHKIEDCVMYD